MFFSIITCTYNPDLGIFKRLVKAINNLNKNKDNNFEWIIVDNNSTKPIIEISFIKEALQKNKNFKIVNETTPGLTNARIKGIKESKNDWIVFFDDDNEPQRDYLIETSKIVMQHPEVACWGPGKIKVVFHNNNKWVEKYRHIYQERDIKGIKTYNIPKWQNGYPQGTGQVVKRGVLLDYINKIETGIYSMNDRQGNSLSSGGDVQIVLNTIKLGYSVGTDDCLAINHHIESSKATFSYLFRLIYGMASSSILCHIQVFPSTKKYYSISNRSILKVLVLYLRQFKIKALNKNKLLILSQRIGDLNAMYNVNSIKKKPLLLNLFERLMNLF